jgi:hypothetical protein
MVGHPGYQDNKSEATQKLFVEFCARYTLAPAQWPGVVVSEKLRRAHPQLEARLLAGRPGAVYLIPSQTLGFFALSTRSDGSCSVTTWRTEPAHFTSVFYQTAPFYAAKFGPASVNPGREAGAISVALPDGRTLTADMAFRPDTADTREVTFTMAVTRGRQAPARPDILTAKAAPRVVKAPPVVVADSQPEQIKPRPAIRSRATIWPAPERTADERILRRTTAQF